MADRKVKLKDQLGRVVRLDDGNAGATVGKNLFGADGKLLKPSDIINPPPEKQGAAATLWKLIREIPANIQALAAMGGVGFPTRTGDGAWFQRSLQQAPGIGIVITNGDGEAGDPTIGLADLANAGTGSLLAFTRDSKGRVTGTKSATITGTSNQINVVNGDAVAGLPTLSLATAVMVSLSKADSAVQEVRPGTGVTVDNTDPRRPIVNATPSPSGVPEAPTDGWPYARGAATWLPLDGPLSPYVLLKLPVLTDQAGNVLTDQQGRVLTANVPAIPWSWITGAPTYSFPPMTLAQANAMAPVADGQPVLITDLAGGREPCWYDATVASGTKFRRFSDRSIAN